MKDFFYIFSTRNRLTEVEKSFDDIDCVTKESNGLCKAMQTTASWDYLRGLAHNFEMN